jgi:hypothetical protein
MPEHPDVEVQLTGTDGNVFALAGKVEKALARAGHYEAAEGLFERLQECQSYDEALQLFMRIVHVR